MKKRLDTRFPAARIKKIMQADEDVGKIAMAVPLLVSKALELFLQDLCNRTYDITLKRGAKTLNSLHLKQCVQTFNVFDFLGEIVSKVPDLGGPDAAGEDRSAAKRRKVTDNEDHSCDEDPNGNRVHEANHASGSGRGRGRGRPRGRGRGSRAADRETAAENGKFEDDPDARNGDERDGLICGGLDDDDEPEDLKEQIVASKNSETPARDFDLNVDLNESGDLKPVLAAAVATPTSSLTKPTPEVHGELPGWSFADMKKMEIDPIQLSNLHRRRGEDEEDYDEES